MPRILAAESDDVLDLDGCLAELPRGGFDPADEASLQGAALALRRLGNNRSFLAEIALADLKAQARKDAPANPYSSQVIMLARPEGDYFLRANIWPAASDPMVRASAFSPFFYGLAHDHNFDFLTLGYHGPGYWSDYYEYDYGAVAGVVGEPVDLRLTGRRRLEPGAIMHYRAHFDVHRQLPPDALSVSINIMRMTPAQDWMDQYLFDADAGRVAGVIGGGANAALLRLAVHLDPGNGRDLAEEFARRHPSDRLRWTAVEALAALDGPAAYERAAASDSALLRGEARSMLERLSANTL